MRRLLAWPMRAGYWLFGGHDDFHRADSDYVVHMCHRFGSVRHTYVIHAGIAHEVDTDFAFANLNELFARTSWLEIMAILRAGNAVS